MILDTYNTHNRYFMSLKKKKNSISIDTGLDKEDVLHTYSRMFLSHEKRMK